MDLSIRTGGDKGKKVTIGPQELVVGRDPAADLTLKDDEVSRKHASFKQLPDGNVELKDLGSRNGTFVDGALITGPRTLRGGEQVRVGETVLVAEAADAGATRIAQRPPAPAGPPGGQKRESKSAIQRIVLERNVKRLTVIAIAAGLLAAAAIVIVVTGVFESESPPTPAEVIKSVTPSTVLVIGNDEEGEPYESGTGWVYDAEKGLIVTNAHVANATTFEVGTSDESLHAAEVVGVSPCDDLAVLKVGSTSGLETLPLGSQEDLEQGDHVFVIGYPGNASVKDELQSTEGSVSAVSTTADPEVFGNVLPEYPNVIQTDAAINHGNSGGPMVDESEKLVGVNTLTGASPEDQTQGQYYAIGVDHVKQVVPALARGESKGWFGFGILNVAQNSEGEPLGVAVEENEVVKGTEADDRGFGETPALITEVNGDKVASPSDYCSAVEGLEPGTETEVGLVFRTTENGEEFFDASLEPERIEMSLEG